MNKRVSGQYHLTLHTQPTYKGLPLVGCESTFVKEYLERLYCLINHAAKTNSRFFAVRVDLRFPQYYSPCGQEFFSNEYLNVFIKALRRRLREYKAERQLAGTRVNKISFEYIWARECGPDSNKPHYHLLLLFNGHAFNSLGHFSDTEESLYNRISESWGEALGIHVVEGGKLTHFPEIGQYLVNSRDPDQLAKVFCRASYLAKVATKNFHDGFHVFGASRF